MLCDGMTKDDLERSIATKISLHGFTMIQVASNPSWTYSIGLVDRPGAADLVCIGVEESTRSVLVADMAAAMVRGEDTSEPTLAAADIQLADVHPAHLRGDMFAAWSRWRGRLPEAGEFRQIVLGPSWFCSCHARQVIRLDGPSMVCPVGPNRAQRRRRGRRR